MERRGPARDQAGSNEDVATTSHPPEDRGNRGGPLYAVHEMTMDHALQPGEQVFGVDMNLKFHVSPASIRAPEPTVVRARQPSMLDLDIEWVDQPPPRGTSYETWQRARGWSSED